MENFTQEQFDKERKDIKERMESNQKDIEAKEQLIKEIKAKMMKNNKKIIKSYINLIFSTIILLLKIPVFLITILIIIILALFNLFGIREAFYNIYNSGHATQDILHSISIYDRYIIHASICFYLIIIFNYYN